MVYGICSSMQEIQSKEFHDSLGTSLRVVCGCAQSCPTLCLPMECNPPGFSVKFSRWEYWSWLPFPNVGDLPNPRIEAVSLVSPILAVDSLPPYHLGSPPLKVAWWYFQIQPLCPHTRRQEEERDGKLHLSLSLSFYTVSTRTLQSRKRAGNVVYCWSCHCPWRKWYSVN